MPEKYVPKSKRGKTEKELDLREKLIERIEGIVGTLESVPWSKVSTEDMRKLLSTLLGTSDIPVLPEDKELLFHARCK